MKEEYFAIKVISSSGAEHWFTEHNGDFTLAVNEFVAKLFHTAASAERFLIKLRERHEDMDALFVFQVTRITIQ